MDDPVLCENTLADTLIAMKVVANFRMALKAIERPRSGGRARWANLAGTTPVKERATAAHLEPRVGARSDVPRRFRFRSSSPQLIRVLGGASSWVRQRQS